MAAFYPQISLESHILSEYCKWASTDEDKRSKTPFYIFDKFADWKGSESIAQANIQNFPPSDRRYNIQGTKAFDGDLEVTAIFDAVRHITHPITFSFYFKRPHFYRNGLEECSRRKRLLDDYIYYVRQDLNLTQKELMVFTTEEERSPDNVHTHSLAYVRDPDPDKLDQILGSMRRLVSDEVHSPYIELSEDLHKTTSYTNKVDSSMPDKEFYATTGYFKMVERVKKDLGLMG